MNWKEPASSEWIRTFTIPTTKPNDVVATFHDRMPVILQPNDYDRWLGDEPDPADLIHPYPADDLVTWPVSTRVNTPKSSDSSLLDRVEANA